MEQIKEAAYLSAPKSAVYRRIMNIFFKEYEKMKFYLYKEDIYNEIKKISEFDDYSMEDLKTDLDALVEWNNLSAIQDTKKVYTISEYKNREFRYSMSERAVILERAAVMIDNLHLETGNLSTNYILRIQDSLEQIKRISEHEENVDKINELWKILQEDFKKLNQNYQDYLRDFYIQKPEFYGEIMEFISYKQKFVSILKNFVRELQTNSRRLEKTIENIKEKMENKILFLIIKAEIENQEMNLNKIFLTPEELKENVEENIKGKWESLKNWFFSSEERKSECRQVLDITGEIIRKILQDAFFLTQKQSWGINKKEEYKKILKMFSECEDIKEAHKLSAHVFGIQNIRHYVTEISKGTESIEESLYDEKCGEYKLESHNRVYKPKLEKSGFENRDDIKEKFRLEYKEKLEENKKMIKKYLSRGKLDISKIEGEVSSDFRKFILNMISAANLSENKISTTEYGQKYKIVQLEERFVLKCEDGNLEMPKFIFEFFGE